MNKKLFPRLAEQALTVSVRQGLHLPRRYTAAQRALPSFLIVGAQKAGTTSLSWYLNQHPEIRMSCLKEVHYFDMYFAKGENWYRSHFPLQESLPVGTQIGEASPYYMIHPHAPKRIHELLPNVKLIMLLRNPTGRAISHYFHEHSRKREPLGMWDALMQEQSRIENEWQRMLRDDCYYSRAHQSYSYQQRGVYADQIERYLTLFDRSQMLFANCDEFFRHPQKVLGEISEFLNVDSRFDRFDVRPQNTGTYDRIVEPRVRQHLDRYFQAPNNRLQVLLDRDLAWRDAA